MTTPAERLERLFEAVHRRATAPQSSAKVATAVSTGDQDHPGVPLTASAVDAFRAGAPAAMDRSQLAAVTHHFGVPAAYFTDDEVAAAVSTQLDYLERLRDANYSSASLQHAITVRSPLSDDLAITAPDLVVDALVAAAGMEARQASTSHARRASW